MMNASFDAENALKCHSQKACILIIAARALPLLLEPGGRPAFLTPAPDVLALGVAVLVVAGAIVLDGVMVLE